MQRLFTSHPHRSTTAATPGSAFPPSSALSTIWKPSTIHRHLALWQRGPLECAARQSASAHVNIWGFQAARIVNLLILRCKEKTSEKGPKPTRVKISPEIWRLHIEPRGSSWPEWGDRLIFHNWLLQLHLIFPGCLADWLWKGVE